MLFDIYMSENTGWIAGAAGTLLHTDDGGNTWSREPSSTTNDLTCIFFLDNDTGWIGGDKLTLLQSKKRY